MANLEVLPGSTALLCGEGPHWIEHDQSLIYVDIPGGYFFRYYTESGRIQKMKLDDLELGSFTSLIVPVAGKSDEFIVAVGRSLGWVKWSSTDPDHICKTPVPICSVDGNAHNRFNDGKCDPKGRLWAGTMAYETTPGVVPRGQGSLFKLGQDLKPVNKVDNLTIPNGLAWSSDGTKFYYIDSTANSVDMFDYDNESGDISNRRVLFDYDAEGMSNEMPDGMCIDSNDNLWVACWRGAQVICIDTKTGKIIKQVKIPSLHVTSCCWGGKDYSTLFVTSSCNGFTRDEFVKRPLTGKVFKVTGLGVRGPRPNEFVLDRNVFMKLQSKGVKL